MNKSKKSKRLRIKSLLDKNVKTFKNKLKTNKTKSQLLDLIQKKYKQLKLPYFFIFLIILPLSILLFTNVNSYLIIFFQIFVYSYLVLSAKKIKINE